MLGLIGLIAILTVLALSLAISRLATLALTSTGLAHEAAHLQARSALTGTGFTTQESEHVIRHPVRRRVIMVLMLLHSAGTFTVLISLILSFAGPSDDTQKLWRLAWIVGGAAGVWGLSRNRGVERWLRAVMTRGLQRWTDLDVRDYESLLKLSGDYAVTELALQNEDWLIGKQLRDCRLLEEGVMVLGIEREDGTYLGAPRSTTELRSGDSLVLYGRACRLGELDSRRAGLEGDEAHAEAVSDHAEDMRHQDQQDAESRRRRKAHPQTL